ncbi:tetratricopeptide repeat protein [Tateyamaria sp. syn59]|uniref:tetratricopeptide repeat protein n=1 Tax=Tateyamaria sp. syn59 TaxID=2576942 RepID=UPI0011BD69F6|nr:sel1 repeat family protein [Tateyamaria sp. syn59]
MRKTLGLLLVCAQIGSAALAGTGAEPSHKELYAAVMLSVGAAPKEAFADLRALSDAGYARATDRLAYFHLKGIGTDADAEAAIALYQQAVEMGRNKSLVSLGKAHLSVGAFAEARETFERAAATGSDRATATLAWAHATGQLGAQSQRRDGWDTLNSLAKTDARHAQLLLLDALRREVRQSGDADWLIEQLVKRAANDDPKAAEVLLQYFWRHKNPSGTLELRQRLLSVPGIRAKVFNEEQLRLAHLTQAPRFWTVSEEMVGGLPSDQFAGAMVVTFKLNKNAYVRILQKELRHLGYSVGRKSPYMNGPLIRATRAFCKDRRIGGECRYGPLKSTTVKAVSRELARIRILGG